MGASDSEQLAYAKRAGRLIITADQDFLGLVREDADHPGVVYWASGRHFGRLIRAIDEICFEKSAEELRGTVIYI